MQKLPRTFYTQRTLTVAKELLGKIFIRKVNGKILSGMIVETEAYLYNDPASHAFRGLTERNKPMFNIGGFLYVYFTYGMHYCANVVTFTEGIGEAVLIRAVDPIDGIDTMMKNRFKDIEKSDFGNTHLHQNLTNGPAKFAQAFSLTKSENGIDLCNKDIFIIDGDVIQKSRIIPTTRVGISTATEKKWRFYIEGNKWVSKK
jgi:DNA-3-methyladenine glycosylase